MERDSINVSSAAVSYIWGSLANMGCMGSALQSGSKEARTDSQVLG